jgi:hypothetical protein
LNLTVTFFLVGSGASLFGDGIVDDVVLDSTATIISARKRKIWKEKLTSNLFFEAHNENNTFKEARNLIRKVDLTCLLCDVVRRRTTTQITEDEVGFIKKQNSIIIKQLIFSGFTLSTVLNLQWNNYAVINKNCYIRMFCKGFRKIANLSYHWKFNKYYPNGPNVTVVQYYIFFL